MQLGTFGAFYTKIKSGKKKKKYSRTGDYADIVVDLGTGDSKMVFWRGSSYLPYLETEEGRWYVDEVVARSGNGEGIQPDRVNAYSHVKIIEGGPDKVVVHWRYLPEFSGINPHLGVEGSKFVDEYFTITPDGQVKRTIRKGTPKIDRWKDPRNRIQQTFTLTASGITGLETREPGVTDLSKPAEGRPVVDKFIGNPVAWWKFDEAIGDQAFESISASESEIHGHKSLWKKGVSGTALQFDGYNTFLELSADKGPVITDGLILEAWIAIVA